MAHENQGRLPSPFSHFDAATIALSATALAAWAFFPESNVTGAMLIAGAILNAMRLARWAGDRTLRDPLVLILHVAFVFVPIGFLLAELAVVLPETVPSAAGIHAFSVGAVACMTLAVMTEPHLGIQAASCGRALAHARSLSRSCSRLSCASARRSSLLMQYFSTYRRRCGWWPSSDTRLCLAVCSFNPNYVRGSRASAFLTREQTKPEHIFSLADLLADRADGDAKLVGRGRHAAASTESLEGLYRTQGRR